MINAVIFIGGFLTVTLLLRQIVLKDNRKDSSKAG